jgi:hypothetical protein
MLQTPGPPPPTYDSYHQEGQMCVCVGGGASYPPANESRQVWFLEHQLVALLHNE